MKATEIFKTDGDPTDEYLNAFNIDCTGDACKGDTVLFSRAVFGGSYKKPYYSHDEQIIAEIIADSYGRDKQQHTFTLKVLFSDCGTIGTIRIKGRNLYRNGTKRLERDFRQRHLDLKEKHARGSQARHTKQMRQADGLEEIENEFFIY